MSNDSKLRKTEKRTRRQQRLTPVTATSKEYAELLAKIRVLEVKKERVELQIQKKLEPVKASLGIYKLEEQIDDLDDQIDDLFADKQRLENLIIQDLSLGKKLVDFALRVVSKRFSISYKSICEKFLSPEQLLAAKDQYGSRKEMHVLVFKGEEVAKQPIYPEVA